MSFGNRLTGITSGFILEFGVVNKNVGSKLSKIIN